jgi:hypothetical protein
MYLPSAVYYYYYYHTCAKNLKRISAKFGKKGRIATKNSNKIDIKSYGSN